MDPVTLALAKSWAEGQFGDLRQLAPYAQALLDSRIVEHNLDVADPPNGWYIRYENGWQGVWMDVDLVDVGPAGSLSLPSAASGPFPAQFAGAGGYIVPGVATRTDGRSHTFGVSFISTDGIRRASSLGRLRAFRSDGEPFVEGNSLRVSIYVVGPWK